MNVAQIVFAQTFNLLYQQQVTDINTMLKVFRRECIDGVTFPGNGFNFDIELVCKIVRNGFSPLEVPVNYVARGFDEGKKINFLLDAVPLLLPALAVPVWTGLSSTPKTTIGAMPSSTTSPRGLPALKAKYLLRSVCRGGPGARIRMWRRPAAQHDRRRPSRALELQGCDIRPLGYEPTTFNFTLVDPDDAALPYDARSFDAVVMFDVLEHVFDPAAVIKSVRAVLKPDGVVVSFTPLEDQPLSFYRIYRRLLGDDLYVDTKEHVHTFSEASSAGRSSSRSSGSTISRARASPPRAPHGRNAVRALQDPGDPRAVLGREPVLPGDAIRESSSASPLLPLLRLANAVGLLGVAGAAPPPVRCRRDAVHGDPEALSSTIRSTASQRDEGGERAHIGRARDAARRLPAVRAFQEQAAGARGVPRGDVDPSVTDHPAVREDRTPSHVQLRAAHPGRGFRHARVVRTVVEAEIRVVETELGDTAPAISITASALIEPRATSGWFDTMISVKPASCRRSMAPVASGTMRNSLSERGGSE